MLILRILIDLIYPPNCIQCKNHIRDDSPSKELCLSCLANIEFNIPPFCPKCSRSLALTPESTRCLSCKKNAPAFDFAWSACLFKGPLKNLLHQFKYNQKTQLRKPFTQCMISFIEQYHFDINQFDYLLAIPLFISHQRDRGYNQSALLADEISRHFNIPITKALKRNRNTQSQTQLSQKERFTNILEAFTIKHNSNIKNKNILIIDDLLTTGATTSEAARILKKNGAARVGVLTLAITI